MNINKREIEHYSYYGRPLSEGSSQEETLLSLSHHLA